jgi:hypothetical protein
MPDLADVISAAAQRAAAANLAEQRGLYTDLVAGGR